MATQDYPILEMTASFPNLGTKTGEFHFKKASTTEGVRTGYLVESGFDNLLGAISRLRGGDQAGRKGVSIDTGGGQHYIEIDLRSLSAEDGQWGYTDDASVIDNATATGGDRFQKQNVLNNYLRYGTFDSANPAHLIYGEYAPGGVMVDDFLNVMVEEPNVGIPREEASTFRGTLTLIDTHALDKQTTSVDQPG